MLYRKIRKIQWKISSFAITYSQLYTFQFFLLHTEKVLISYDSLNVPDFTRISHFWNKYFLNKRFFFYPCNSKKNVGCWMFLLFWKTVCKSWNYLSSLFNERFANGKKKLEKHEGQEAARDSFMHAFFMTR